MPAWLVEGNPYVYFALACIGAGFFYAWWRTRRPRYAIVTGVLVALIVGIALLDHFVESDGEQMVRKVSEVADAVSMNDVDRGFLNVSSSFDYKGANKDQFFRFCKDLRNSGKVTEVKVWDKQAVEVSRDAKSGAVAFRFKIVGSWGETPGNHIAKVVFVLDSDGQWRVKDFDVYDAINQSKTPIPIPGLGGR
jgi:hypothetical protein